MLDSLDSLTLPLSLYIDFHLLLLVVLKFTLIEHLHPLEFLLLQVLCIRYLFSQSPRLIYLSLHSVIFVVQKLDSTLDDNCLFVCLLVGLIKLPIDSFLGTHVTFISLLDELRNRLFDLFIFICP